MSLFKFCWYADWLILLVAVYFFVTGISTATPGSGFGKAWTILFLTMAALLMGSYWLHKNGQTGLATVIAAIPFGAALLYLLFILITVLSGARWN
jgi:hypothetical protein